MAKENEPNETYKKFKELVNMTASQIEKWLNTEEAKNTSQDSGNGEAIGHKSGKMIVDICERKRLN